MTAIHQSPLPQPPVYRRGSQAPAPRPRRRRAGRRATAFLVTSALLCAAVTAVQLHRTDGSDRDLTGGDIADGTSVFSDTPALANLAPELLTAVRAAATDAADLGATLTANSGWRSADYQRRLLSDAVDDYGSLEEASRWVAPPETSLHVAGAAVDLGPVDGAAWLDQNGAAYGLCRTYANEGWHFEYFGDAPTTGCPTMYTDAAHDPRLL